MNARAASGFALAALLFSAGGCASSGPYWSQEDQSAAVNTELRERVTGLETQLAAANERNAALQARVDGLERELEGLRRPADTPAVEAPRDPETAAGTPAPRERSQIEQSDLDELETVGGGDLPGAPAGSAAGADAGPRELYESSLRLLEQRNLPEAEAGFSRFLAANPTSDLADNAQFWLAECALRRGDVASALAGFRAVVENYPEANKVPDALLKVGFCLATLGEPESAATVYRELLARFPETAAAETARQRLGAP
jgi:tol-pal system protein YbgF